MTPLVARLAAMILLAVGCMTACAEEQGQDLRGSVIRVKLDTLGAESQITPVLVAEFERETGIQVAVLDGPNNVSEWLLQSRMLLGSRSASVDVYQVDIIWTGMLGEHFLDLGALIEDDRADFYDAILENNTVAGRLVAIPWFTDAGLLYYRADLLEKYGFDGPPETWDELEEMALAIMQGERAEGNADFWGYVWQATAQETLTCTGLELQASHGGGTILGPAGEVQIDTPGARAALERAIRWLGTISPPALLEQGRADPRHYFLDGRAAFLRDWSAFHGTILGPDSPMRDVGGEAVLPAGKGGRAATLGGWQLAVSRYSANPEAAKAFVEWMTSPATMERRAREAGFVPPRRSVNERLARDEERWLAVIAPTMEIAVARPSRQSGPLYNDVSTLYYRTLHRALRGEVPVDRSLSEMAATLRLWGIGATVMMPEDPPTEGDGEEPGTE